SAHTGRLAKKTEERERERHSGQKATGICGEREHLCCDRVLNRKGSCVLSFSVFVLISVARSCLPVSAGGSARGSERKAACKARRAFRLGRAIPGQDGSGDDEVCRGR